MAAPVKEKRNVNFEENQGPTGANEQIRSRGKMSGPPRTPRRSPPPIPLRGQQQSYTTPMYRSPYSGGYGGYSGGMYGGYGGYSSYGAMGPSAYNRLPVSNFVRLVEDSSRPAFDSMENIVQAFGSIAMVLESTSFAVQSSFRAVLGLAEHFSRLRLQTTSMIQNSTLIRTLRYLYRRLLVFLRLRSADNLDMGSEDVWRELASSEGLTGKGRRKSSWPLMLFFCIVIGGPYIIWRLMASMKDEGVVAESWVAGESEHFVGSAEYDYDAENEDEISFSAGQEIRIAPKALQPRVRGWLLASVDGEKSGLIPANYIRIRGRRAARTTSHSTLSHGGNVTTSRDTVNHAYRGTSHSTVWSEVGGRKKETGETETSSAESEVAADGDLPSADSAGGAEFNHNSQADR